MTKKHFKAIAQILKGTKASVDTVIELSAYFETVNPNFHRWKFYAACGFEAAAQGGDCPDCASDTPHSCPGYLYS
jgi:hypothetical protein